MNRLPTPLPQANPEPDSGPASLLARSVREPALLRLAQSIEELNPDLARALCLSGLAAMTDPAERESWRARLEPWLEDREDSDDDDEGGLLVAA